MIIDLCGEHIELISQKAFFWEKQKLLGLSDIHFGKALSLQLTGIPIPTVDTENLLKLAFLISKFDPKRVLILGDFIHQKDSWTPELFDELLVFFNEFSDIDWTLIIGNHEKGSLDLLKLLPLKIVEDGLTIEPFTFTHGHQSTDENAFSIQGHIHPVVTIREGSIRLRLPCFVVGENNMTIPSFGALTGGYEVDLEPGEKVYAVTDESVFEVPREIDLPQERPHAR